MKLGRAVEISPKVLMVQFTSWERMSQAASADSVQLSTCFTSSDSTFRFKYIYIYKKPHKNEEWEDGGVRIVSASMC